MKFLNFSLLLWDIFSLLDPDPDPDSKSGSLDLIESGSETLVPISRDVLFCKIYLTEFNFFSYNSHSTVSVFSKSHFNYRHCCVSEMFVPDPGSWMLILSIPDIGSRVQQQQQKRGEGGNNLFSYLFFCSHKFLKAGYYFIFEEVQHKNWSQLTKNFSFFYPKKLSPSSQKYGLRIRDPENHRIPDPQIFFKNHDHYSIRRTTTHWRWALRSTPSASGARQVFIRDVYPGSRIRIFFIPDAASWILIFPSRIPDPHQRI
jgi:hypothetical protein